MDTHRWTSRKFLVSLSVQATAIAVLLWPEHESAIVESGRSITALIVMMLSGLGYVKAEAALDRQQNAAKQKASRRKDTASETLPS